MRGFRIDDVNKVPAGTVIGQNDKGEYEWSTYITAWDYCENQPNNMCASKQWNGRSGAVLTSTDGGKNWKWVNDPQTTDFAAPKIAMSADDPKNMVFVPGGGAIPKYTLDGGSTWMGCKKNDGSPMRTLATDNRGGYVWPPIIVSDKKDGQTFYAYTTFLDNGSGKYFGEVWVSRNRGANWTNTAKFNRGAYGYAHNMYDVNAPCIITVNPGKAGEVWVSNAGNGLYKSTDFGSTFSKVNYFSGNSRNLQIAFGKNAPDKDDATPSIYVYGISTADANNGLTSVFDQAIYRSTDNGQTWNIINRESYKGLYIRMLAGDRQTFGKIYFLENFHGALYYGNPDSPTGTVITDDKEQGFQVFPNPAGRLAVISYRLSENSNVKISVCDVMGKEVLQVINEKQIVGEHKININAGQLQAGIYFVKMNVNGQQVTRKLLVNEVE